MIRRPGMNVNAGIEKNEGKDGGWIFGILSPSGSYLSDTLDTNCSIT